MDDETLLGSGRSPQTSPRSGSTTTSPKTAFTGGTLGTGRRRPLYNLVDVVADLKHSNEHHAGSSLFIAIVGIMGGVGRADDLISDG